MAYAAESIWSTAAMSVALTFISASAIISLYLVTKKSRELGTKVQQLEASLAASLKKTAAERQGRIRAQQALRKAVAEPKSDSVECTSYPMTPIGMGLQGNLCSYLLQGHDLDKLWKDPSKSKFKAKVRVPRLKGERVGVFATRSPHRPCPIGLTVAKVEAVQGHEILLSGADLVDGTPVLDVKPYLPYCDSVQDATVPKWLLGDSVLTVASICFSEEFTSALSKCWPLVEKKSLYASEEELKNFVKQVLSWDIRSVSQRSRPHCSHIKTVTGDELLDESSDSDGHVDDKVSSSSQSYSKSTIYHLLVDGLDVSYTIGYHGDVVVDKVELASPSSRTRSN
ncbi:uncharacterized protein LOC103494312 isoform X3 [Cucumis melo]|uniref:Uncharacterized protein LOC103494312 isoform X3 n=1 Tax=Cucumis melo TaxID=3656 RepID=A0A1S3BWT2_CUCME|nr:uncharacterized protein LOC103494312 isoform X3 [Cucumis melo]